MAIKSNKKRDPIKRLNLGVKSSTLALVHMALDDANQRAEADGDEPMTLNEAFEQIVIAFISGDKDVQAYIKKNKGAYDAKLEELRSEKQAGSVSGDSQ